jgi:hypothetical protein
MLYTDLLMKRFSQFLVCWLFVLPAAFAAETPFQPGKIVDIEQKVNTKVLYYLVNTPVTKDEPYFDVSVLVGDTTYIGEYTPRHANDTLPEDFKINSPVQIRVEKRRMYLKGPASGEVELVVIKRLGPKLETDKK